MMNSKNIDAEDDGPDIPQRPKDDTDKSNQSAKQKKPSTEGVHMQVSKKEEERRLELATASYKPSIDHLDDEDITMSRFESRHVERENSKISTNAHFARSNGRNSDDVISRFTALQVERQEKKCLPALEKGRRMSNEEGNDEEQMKDILKDDDLPRPGAYQVGGQTNEEVVQNQQNLDENSSANNSNDENSSASADNLNENQFIQSLTVVANLAPDTDAIQVENDELRRRLQERDNSVVAGSAKVIHTWICGLSRRQILYLFVFVFLVVIAAVAAVLLATLSERKSPNLETPSPTSTLSERKSPNLGTPSPTSTVVESIPTLNPSSTPTIKPTSEDERLFIDILTKADPTLDLSEVLNSTPFQWILTDTYTISSLDVLEENPSILLERYILAVLYFGTGGENWDTQYEFLSPLSHCQWQHDDRGIFCNDDGLVEKIKIVDNNLSGTIPTLVGNFLSLRNLSLQFNNLSGELPTQIGNLINLEYLLFYSNQLTGTIPTHVFNLLNLSALEFDRNELTGTIPTLIGHLVLLRDFDLYDNWLSSTIPTEIGNLSNLRVTELMENFFTGTLPTQIGNCRNLESIYLYENDLSGTIPSHIGNLSNLRALEIDSNNLSGTIPLQIWNLLNLETLHLYGNDISGTIPTQIGNVLKLQELKLYANMLSSTIPTHIGNLSNLLLLELDQNNLSGKIPTQIGNLTNLEELYLSGNNLTGDLNPLFCDGNVTFLSVVRVDCVSINCSCCADSEGLPC